MGFHEFTSRGARTVVPKGDDCQPAGASSVLLLTRTSAYQYLAKVGVAEVTTTPPSKW